MYQGVDQHPSLGDAANAFAGDACWHKAREVQRASANNVVMNAAGQVTR